MILILWGVEKREAGGAQSKQSERRDYTVANENLARGDIGIESVYARQVLQRERDRDGIRGNRGDRAKERGTKRQKEDAQGGEGEEERERVRWRGANQTVHFANSPTFWFAAMERHYLQRSLW